MVMGMAKIKQRFKELCCFLRGGCVYHDWNLEYTYDVREVRYILRNKCVRCGRAVELKMPGWWLRLPPVQNTLYVNVDGERIAGE